MATSAIYRMLPVGERDTTEATDGFPLVGRKDWTFTLRTLRLASGGSYQVTIDGSPDGTDNWAELYDFGTINAASIASTPSPSVKHLEIAEEQNYIRANLAAASGENVMELLADGRYLDPYNANHLLMLSQRVRNYDDGVVRIVEGAEDDILQYLGKDINGILQATVGAECGGLARPDALDHIQAGIVLQTDWNFQKEELARSKEADDVKALEKMGRYHPSVGDRLSAIMTISAGNLTWQGR